MHDTPRSRLEIDLAAFDEVGHPVLFAEIKARTGALVLAGDQVRKIAAACQRYGLSAPFLMVADLERINIFGNQDDPHQTLLFDASTAEILRFYDPTFDQKRIFEDYFTSLLNAWLHDLADRWKSPDPPGVEPLSRIGLVERLRGGDTRREVSLVQPDLVSRNQFLDESLSAA